MKGKVSPQTVFQGFIAQQGIFKRRLKLKNSMLDLEDRLNRLNVVFSREQKDALGKSLKKDRKEFSKMGKRIKSMKEKLAELNAKTEQMKRELEKRAEKTAEIRVKTREIEEKARVLEEQTSDLRRRRAQARGNVEKMKMKRKEILQDKKMRGEDGLDLHQNRLRREMIQEIEGKIRVELKIEEEEEVGLAQIEEFLKAKKKSLLQVKIELENAAGNLNNEEFLKYEKEKVKATTGLIQKARNQLRSNFLVISI